MITLFVFLATVFKNFIFVSFMVFILDEKDRFILRELRANSRMPFLKIAKKLNCSEGLVRKRVKQLVEKGVIKKFSIEIDAKSPLEAVVCIKTEAKKTKEVVEVLQRFSENVFPIFEVTGRFDVVCVLHANETKELNKIIDAVRETKNVLATESFLVTAKG